MNQTIQIYNFTDPVCSYCYAIDPYIKKLELSYSKHIKIHYVMGGLLKSFKDYQDDGGFIKNSSDIYKYLLDVAKNLELPINLNAFKGDVIDSSYVSSIYAKAVNLFDNTKYAPFLRSLREHLFLLGEKIDDKKIIENILKELDINPDSLNLSLAETMFKQDLILNKNFNIKVFPSFVLKYKNKYLKLEGYVSYEEIIKNIKHLMPEIQPNVLECDLKNFHNIYKNFTKREAEIILDTKLDLETHYKKIPIEHLEYYTL